MSKFLKTAAIAVFGVIVMSVGLTAPASADVNIRTGKAADLPIRANTPSAGDIERSYAGFYNPNVPLEPKYAVSYRGDTPKVRKALQTLMGMSKTYDYFSIQGRITKVNVNGNRMSVTGNGVMAGFPATSFTYHYIREAGIWKYDWKANCATGCQGNPDFGY
ncbi:hypothetical protein QSJ18_02025 [Gordonia sp. ABSL1-1]|uniref:hypothetical protein n=1 Tax=Gordonia sp. ABSL1-1 TaxID=3053923 RepID=UPI00257260FB|nr:hypothetical protein [Gordonia sp. ABSL1-1]MDL9935514.1 hypothetical protein [Gordonia sp. ABSL1-1]